MPVHRPASRSKRRNRATNRATNRIRSMRCSPIVDGKTATDNTCYTNDILLKLREAYHKNHPDQPPIATTTPAKIHEELKRRLQSTCPATEDCWLQELPTAQRHYIDKRIFAPDQPTQWSKNPQEWLSNFDIERVLHQYEVSHPHFVFIGPTPIDFDTKIRTGSTKAGAGSETCVWNDLCNFDLAECVRRGKTHVGIIFNLDTHDQGGSHWVSMFIHLPSKCVYYFDSAANPTPPEIKKFVRRLQTQATDTKYDENYPKQHQRSNTECGMYSLYFIITMLKTARPAEMWSRKFKQGRIPDRTMIQLRNVYYNHPTKGGNTRTTRRHSRRRGGAGEEEPKADLHRGMRAKVTMGVKRSQLDIDDETSFKLNNKDKNKLYNSRVTPHYGYVNVQYLNGSLMDEMDTIDEQLAQILYGKTHSKHILPFREYIHSMDVPGMAKRSPTF